MKNFLLTALAILAAVCSCGRSDAGRLQSGDLVFVASASSDGMDGAIASATADGAALSFVHVAIVDVDDDGAIWIVEATPKKGVVRHPLESFIGDNTEEDGSMPTMVVMRLDAEVFEDAGVSADDCVARAVGFEGRSYDFSFLPDNDAFYCSELVYESFVGKDGAHLFEAAPMNFLAEDGSCPEYWTDLFGSMGMDVPQGIAGTNPQDMSADRRLTKVCEWLSPVTSSEAPGWSPRTDGAR